MGLTVNVEIRIIMFDCELGIVKYVVAMPGATLCNVAMEHIAERMSYKYGK